MNVKYINPFIESVGELFTTMLGCQAKRGEVGVARLEGNPRDLTALIGLSGPARGMVALSFPIPTALKIVSKLMGKETRIVDETATDVVAECVNIVTGSAKAKLNALAGGEPIDLSLPTVIRGSQYTIEYPSKSVWLEVPFSSELGPFSMRVTLAYEDKKGRSGA